MVFLEPAVAISMPQYLTKALNEILNYTVLFYLLCEFFLFLGINDCNGSHIGNILNAG